MNKFKSLLGKLFFSLRFNKQQKHGSRLCGTIDLFYSQIFCVRCDCTYV